MSEYCIVLTAFKNQNQAKAIIDQILREKLVACVQEIGIESHYIWKNELYNENEVLVLLKTRTELYGKLKSKLLKIHPYETPEIIRVDISDGSTGYLSWIDAMTNI